VKLIILLRKQFTIENLDYYLNELAKDYIKITKRRGTPIEIIIVGGASILINYGFRNNTNDVDALLNWGFLDQSINNISVKFDLDKKWLNSDFTRTNSYTPKLFEYSIFYKSFQKILDVRTIKAEYLIAMKMVSGRIYKNDLSDVVGILMTELGRGNRISKEMIDKSLVDLYGNVSIVKEDIIKIVYKILEKELFYEQYDLYLESEKRAKEQLLNLREINDNNLIEDDFTNFSDIFIQNIIK